MSMGSGSVESDLVITRRSKKNTSKVETKRAKICSKCERGRSAGYRE